MEKSNAAVGNNSNMMNHVTSFNHPYNNLVQPLLTGNLDLYG